VSKARLVITAVVVEGRSQAQVSRAYGVSQPWISRLVARWRSDGDTAFEPRSRRPRSSPNATPASVLTDNGLVYTTRFAGGRRGKTTRNGFEAELARLGIQQKNSSPNHPQTCGKIERFHQTSRSGSPASRQPAP
jgi:transposase InsO family protein